MDALRSRFESVVAGNVGNNAGDTYHYTVNHCVRFPAFTLDCINGLADDSTVYVLSPGKHPVMDLTIGGDSTGDTEEMMPIDITLLRYFKPSSENPFDPPAEDRIATQAWLQKDAHMALYSDRSLGGVAIIASVTSRDYSVETTYDSGIPWVVTFMRVEVQCVYTDDQP